MQNHAHFAQCMHVWPFTASQYTSWRRSTTNVVSAACQHQRLKIKLVDHGRGWTRPDVSASGRIGVAGARCWARPRAQSKKKNFNADFSSKRTGSDPPPPPNERRSFEKKMSIIGDGPLAKKMETFSGRF